MVPTHTPDNTDPAGWQHPPVPEAWWPAIRHQAPGFDPSRTPSRWMGVLAEAVRSWPGAVRSDHPQVSFAALGKHAAAIADGHRLDDALGEQSPLGAVYRLDGKGLLLGCGHDSNTSLHLAEWRQTSPPRGATGSSVRHPDGTTSGPSGNASQVPPQIHAYRPDGTNPRSKRTGRAAAIATPRMWARPG